MELTDEQWAVLGPLVGEMPKRADGRGVNADEKVTHFANEK
jgi:hypothetical protein